jgi:putative ABC transport system permease protein
VPLREHWFGWIRGPLFTLAAALVLMFLIACANVSTLMLARLPARQPEITMRVLLGAGRSRIIRQFLTESLLLSLIAGVLGVLIAWWGVSSLENVAPPIGRMPLSSLRPNAGFAALAIGLSIVSTLFFGVVPALMAFSSGNDLRYANAHRKSGKLSGILVSVQVALALVLLVSSGLLINSFVRLIADERGYDPKDILTFEYRVPLSEYLRKLGANRGMPTMEIAPPTDSIRRVFEKLKALPDAESVAGSSVRPINGILLPRATILIDERRAPSTPTERADSSVVYLLVTDNFFATMKTRIVRGREFDARDSRVSPWGAVINETMARRFWPGENPIGKRFTVDAVSGEQPREVVGVVVDVSLNYIPTGPAQPVAYTFYLQQPEHYEGFNAGMFGQMIFYIRSARDPAILARTVREAVAEVEPNRPIADIQKMTDFLEGGMRTRAYYATALGTFAVMATILAALGVYGVMSSSVSQRTREIGIHIAMGAGTGDIFKLVARRMLRLIVIGLFAGFLASLAFMRFLEWQLWGVSSTDPMTFVAVMVLLFAVASLASFFPARRAIRVDPTEALRVD